MYELVELREKISNSTESMMTTDLEMETMQHYRSKRSPAPEFSPDIWEDVGCSLLRALLDYDGINPRSRLMSSAD